MVIKNSKAQMKIQQMSFMLIAVTIFFVLVGMSFVVIKISGIQNSATELQAENALLLVSKIANSPEFSCGNSFGESKTNCLDMDKIMMLKENVEEYENFWGVSNIEIRMTSPNLKKEIECTPRNYPNCNYIRLIDKSSKGFDYSNYVALCKKENYGNGIREKCDLGQIIVRYENVE